MERPVYTLTGLPKPKSLPYAHSLEYYSTAIEPTMTSSPIPIIIDNGSFEFRAGWAVQDEPMINFRNIMTKPKSTKETGKSYYLVGNELNDISLGKTVLKSPFDKNVVCHPGLIEHVLDYAFAQLGNSSDSIKHPVFMTEPLCNPLSARGKLSELLFECYQVPSVAYGVDSALGFYYHSQKADKSAEKPGYESATGLVIALQNACTHIYPIINGRIQFKFARRIDVGGSKAVDQLFKSLQLKYPYLRTNITPEIAEELTYRFSYCAGNFQGQLAHLEKRYEEQMAELRNKMKFGGNPPEESKAIAAQDKLQPALKVYKNQISYENEKMEAAEAVKYENEITVQLPFNPALLPSEEEIKQRQEMRKEQGRRLKEYMQKKREEKKAAMQQEYEELKGIEKLKDDDRDAFKECILARGFEKHTEFEKRISFLAQKLGLKPPETEKEKEEEKYSLLSIPDEKLTPEQLKQKRIQKMQKTAAIQRAEKKELQRKEQEHIEEMKKSNPQAYLQSLYMRRKDLLDKLDEVKRKKLEFTSRGSTASQRRMQTIAALGIGSDKKGTEDTFGKSDADWEIYRGISRDALEEEEEEYQQQLADLEELISAADPSFNMGVGIKPPTAEDFQIILSAERFRGIEAVFEPGIFGVDQAGIVELIEGILRQYDFETRKKLVGNIYVTGGFAQIPGFSNRIETEVRMLTDPDTSVVVNYPDTPMKDAWKGAAIFCQNEDMDKHWITIRDYEEKGPEYLKEHTCSNLSIEYTMKDIPQVTTKRKKYI